MKTATDREFGNSKSSIHLIVAYDRILFSPMIYEIAIRHPLRLHEFKLLFQMRTDQKENPAPLPAIIFQVAFRKRLSVVRASTQELVKIYRHNLVFQRIAWVYAPDVRAERALESLHVIFIAESVIAVRVGPQAGIITPRSQHQRCAAAPSADHLRSDQLFFFRRRSLLPQILSKRCHSGVEFAKCNESTVTPQCFGLRGCRCFTEFVRVSHNELAGLDRRPITRMDIFTAAFNLW